MPPRCEASSGLLLRSKPYLCPSSIRRRKPTTESPFSLPSRKRLGKHPQEQSPQKPTGEPGNLSARRTDTSAYLELRADYHTNLVTVHRTRRNLSLSSEKRLSKANWTEARIGLREPGTAEPECRESLSSRWRCARGSAGRTFGPVPPERTGIARFGEFMIPLSVPRGLETNRTALDRERTRIWNAVARVRFGAPARRSCSGPCRRECGERTECR
jgi:hypothetical protein